MARVARPGSAEKPQRIVDQARASIVRPPPPLPRSHSHSRRAAQVLSYSEATMPGDIGHLGSIGIGEGKPIWERMAMLMRCARLLLAQSPKCPGITSAQPRPRAARSLELLTQVRAHVQHWLVHLELVAAQCAHRALELFKCHTESSN